MSEQEDTFNDREQKKSSRSRSRSRSQRKRSRSRSKSSRRSYSRSRSRSRSRGKRSRSRSRDRKYRSRSRSRDRRRSSSRGRRHRSHSKSPFSNRRRHAGNREDPEENPCIGIFGLSLYTNDRDLREVFGRFGPLDSVNVVHDHQTGRSRGFAFVTYEALEDAREAKEKTNGMEIDGRRIRVDFSITKRPHTPTPGIYMGKPTRPRRDYGYGKRSPSPEYRRRSPSPDYRRKSRSPDYRRRRSPSPYRRGGYSRSRSRSPRDYRRY